MSRAFLELLFDAAVKSTAALCVAGLTLAVFRRASASVQHLIWSLAIAAAVAFPALSAVLPTWKLEVLSAPEPIVEELSEPIEPLPALRLSLGEPALASAPVPSPAQKLRIDVFAVLGAIWAVGALVVLGRVALSRLAVRRLARQARVVDDGALASLVFEASVRLGLERPVRLLHSERVPVPMTYGIVRPTVLFPTEATRWRKERAEPVLLHELAHVARHDALTQLLAQLACALYWFNPAVWLAARRMKALREYACDDEVLRAGVRASAYAEEILSVARAVREHEALSAASLGMGSQLRGRLVAILDPSRSRGALPARRAALSLALAAALAVPLAMIRPARADSELAAVILLDQTEPYAAPEGAAAPAAAPTPPAPPAPAAPAVPAAPPVPPVPPVPPKAAAPRAKAAAKGEPASAEDQALLEQLERLADEGLSDAASRRDFVKQAEQLRDSRLRAKALELLLAEAEIDVDTGRAVLEAAMRLESDRDLAAVLELMHRIRESDLVRGPLANQYLDGCARMKSEDRLARCLQSLLHPKEVDRAVVLRALSMAETLRSSRNRAAVLREVTDHQKVDAAVEAAYLKVMEGMDDESRDEASEQLDGLRSGGEHIKTYRRWAEGRLSKKKLEELADELAAAKVDADAWKRKAKEIADRLEKELEGFDVEIEIE